MNYPKDNVVRILEGDRGHRTKAQKDKVSFALPTKSPKKPAGLAEIGKKYWNKYVRLYRIMDGDVPAFSYLCELASEIEELKAVLKDEGRFFMKVTVDGAGVEHQEKKSHPAFTQLIKLRSEKRIMEKEFRLRATASVRKTDELEDLLR